MKKFQSSIILCSAFLILIGCNASQNLPSTLGEARTSYSYIPLDPLPVLQGGDYTCFTPLQLLNGDPLDENTFKLQELLLSLPDQAVRLAVAQTDISGNVTFGPATVGYKGSSYQVILDYISVDATNIPVHIQRTVSNKSNTESRISIYDDSVKTTTRYRISRTASSHLMEDAEFKANEIKRYGEIVVIPVYIGVGLRLTASVYVKKGTVNLSSLGALAAEAEAGNLTGSLTVQTLGVTGKGVSASIPLPSEINQTTIQNAILSLGTIKAVLHDAGNTTVTPRVVGIYNPIGGGQEVVNGIISALAESPITWHRPCIKISQQSSPTSNTTTSNQ